jgi:hypothetical protein
MAVASVGWRAKVRPWTMAFTTTSEPGPGWCC